MPESKSGRMCGCWSARGGLDLLHEALGAEHGGELGLQDLEGDLAVVLEVLGEVDRRHAALAELALDAVAIGEGGREAIGGRHQEAVTARTGRFIVRRAGGVAALDLNLRAPG